MQSSVAEGISSPAEQARQHSSGSRRLIFGQAEEKDPKETESEVQLSRRNNRQGKQSKRVNGLGRRQDCSAEPEGYFTGLA